MCGCSSNFAGDEGLNFTGNRPSIVEVGEGSSFDFTGNRPSVVEVGEGSSFDFVGDLDGNTQFDDFLGKKAKARRQERRLTKQGLKSGEVAPPDTQAGQDPTNKNQYESSSFLKNNWIYIVLGVAVVGGGYWYFKKRK
jgi:LPXTG-motif cell wall-anchored protein